MTSLTQQERARLTGLWRSLARLTRHFVADPREPHAEFRRLAAEAANWASPLDGYADAFMLFGFARVASSLAKSRLDALPPRGRAGAHLAEVVAEMLGPDPEADAPAQAWWADH